MNKIDALKSILLRYGYSCKLQGRASLIKLANLPKEYSEEAMAMLPLTLEDAIKAIQDIYEQTLE